MTTTNEIDAALAANSQSQGLRTHIDADNPWPGLDFFTEDAANFFNGRNKESVALLHRIQDSPLTVLFGKSGLGKTSLLQAGLFPKLRKNKIHPIYIRLDFCNHTTSLITQVSQAFKAEINGQNIEAPDFSPNETLWEYLHRRKLDLWSNDNWQITPLLVFDQFEEIHTLVGLQDSDNIYQFKIFLADLIENRIPADLNRQLESDVVDYNRFSFRSQRLKILLSFREDFLANFESWKRQIPSIIHNRVRLEPMNSKQAIDAVYESGKTKNIVNKEIAAQIVRMVAQNTTDTGKTKFVTNDSSIQLLATEATIEPTILSLICHGLNETRKQNGKDTIDASLLNTKGGQARVIIQEFYNNALHGLPNVPAIKTFIEDELITAHGFRKQCSKDDAISKGIDADTLLSLVDRRLLRQITRDQIKWYELTHDLLSDVIIRSRNMRELIEEKTRQQQQILECEEKKLLEERAKSADHYKQKARNFKVFTGLLSIALAFAAYQTWQADIEATKANVAIRYLAEANKTARLARERNYVAEEERILLEIEKDIAFSKSNKEKRTLSNSP